MDLNEELKQNGGTKTNRERIMMKYSPLVERYLMSHKYETMNNVREWKMLLTQRQVSSGVTSPSSGQMTESDKKFERYKKIAETAVLDMKKSAREYKKFCGVWAEKMRENEKAFAQFTKDEEKRRK